MKTAILASVAATGLLSFAEPVPIGRLDTSDVSCGWGSVHVDRSVLGNPMKIGGKTFAAGLGVHAPSKGELELGGSATRFEATVGVDDEEHGGGSVEFKVRGDGKLLWESGLMRARCAPRTKDIDLDVTGVEWLTLEVTDGGDNMNCDHADWANARFTFKDDAGLAAATRQLGILTPKAGAAPRINGARVFGVRPGHPVLFRVPVTGEAPLSVAVEKPEQADKLANLHFDPATRLLSGTADEPGDYRLVVRASNAKGTATRDFTLRVGETISLTPAMGWNSWNCFAGSVTPGKVRAAADAMIATGLADHGWSYVNIDDFWEKWDEAEMKPLADYIHAKGLKAGLYSSPGPKTCGGNRGSWGRELADAKAYADWGYDFLKYDWCSYGEVAMGQGLPRAMYPYLVMGRALRLQNRDILFSLCQYGMDDVSRWGALVGGQSWRTTGDVFDNWRSISASISAQKHLWYFTKPGAWNDPDMLCVGKMTWNRFKGSRLAPNEQYTHISLWALVASPLMIGCDLTQLDDFTLSLLTNDEVIEIDQDPLGKGAARVAEGKGWEVWARPLANGDVAMGLYNKTLKEREIKVGLKALGLEGKWRVRDCWRQADEGVFEGEYELSVPGHATHLIRLSPAGGRLRPGLTDIRENAWRMEVEKLKS